MLKFACRAAVAPRAYVSACSSERFDHSRKLIRNALLGSTALIAAGAGAGVAQAQTITPSGGGTISGAGVYLDATAGGGGVQVLDTLNPGITMNGVNFNNGLGAPTTNAFQQTSSQSAVLYTNLANTLTTTQVGGAALDMYAPTANLTWAIGQFGPNTGDILTGSYGARLRSDGGFINVVNFNGSTSYIANGSAVRGVEANSLHSTNLQLGAADISGFSTGIFANAGVDLNIETTGGAITGGFTGVDARASQDVTLALGGNITAASMGVTIDAGRNVSAVVSGGIAAGAGAGLRVSAGAASGNTIEVSGDVSGQFGINMSAGGFTTTIAEGASVTGVGDNNRAIIGQADSTIINHGSLLTTLSSTGLSFGVQFATSGTLTNTGVIDADTSAGFGAYANQALTLANSGSISAGSTGVYAGAGSTITNLDGGVIVGGNRGIILIADATVDLQAGSTTGAIEAGSSAGDITLSVAGALTGAYTGGAGADAVTLAATGAMTSASLGAGDDSFTWEGGAFTGPIDGGAGTDAFISDLGAGSASLSLNAVTGFESYAHQSGDLTLTGSRIGGAGWTLVPGSSLTLDGLLNVAGIGIQMNGNGTPATVSIADGAELSGFIGVNYNTGATNNFSNAGTIAATQTGVFSNGGLVAINSGTITAGTAGAFQFGFGNSTLTNSGTLTGGSDAAEGFGVLANLGGGATINNTGVITGGAGGIRGAGTDMGSYRFAGPIVVNNGASGVITGAVGILIGPDAPLTVTNAGVIQGTTGSAIQVTGADLVSITNELGGQILSGGQADVHTVHVLNGLTLTNAGTIANTGGVITNRNYGVYSAAGTATIDNLSTGEITGIWSGVMSTGELALVNAGLINGDRFAGVETTAGSITNLAGGRLQALASGGYGVLINLGDVTVDNQLGGEIQGGSAGIFNRGAGVLSVSNAGDIYGAQDGVSSVGAASITNAASGTIIGADNGVALSGGAGLIHNAGVIRGLGGDAILGFGGLTITNVGVVDSSSRYAVYAAGSTTVTNEAAGEMTGAGGVRVDGDLVLNNAGLIFSSGGWDRAVTSNGTASIVNVVGGEISATNNNALYLSGADSTVENAGLIQSTGPNSAVYLRGDNASVTNLAGGSISAESLGRGLWFDRAGSVQNAGRISGFVAVDLRGGGVVDNLAGGVLEGESSGVFSGPGATLTLVNEGLVTGGSHAVIASGGTADVTNTATGVMRGGTFNAVYAAADGSTVVNAGLMEGGNAAIYLDGADAVIDNSGVVRVTGTTAPTVVSGVYVLGAGASITNSGTIESTLSGGRGIFLAGGAGSIVNQAGGVISGLDASAIILAGADYVLELQSGSTVNGDIDATASDGVDFTLGGALNGGFFGGIGDDTLTLIGGAAYTGPLDAGDGVDALVLGGAADGTLDVGTVFDVESRVMSGTGTWTLTGSDALAAAWTVNSGVLAVSGGGAIGDGVAVNLAADGTLRVLSSEAIGALNGAGAVDIDASQVLFVGVDDSDSLFAGDLSGEGGLSQSGTGTLTLSGVNSLAGDTRVDAGVLRLGGSDALSASSRLIVQSGAALDLQAFDATAAEAYLDGVVDGSGTLTAALYSLTGATINAGLGEGAVLHNSGVSQLNGTSAAELLHVAAGTLRIGADERLADTAELSVAAGAIFDLAGQDETIGSLWGEGAIELGGGSLTFGGADSGFDGTLSGLGAVNHTAGLFTLLGDHSVSALNNTGGELRFFGATTGDVHVTGGVLSGQAGIDGQLTVSAGGVLSPGLAGVNNGIGVFAAGGLTMNGGVLAVDLLGVSGGNLVDQVLVGGVANLTGGTLQTNFVGSIADFDFAATYVVVAADTLIGAFDNGREFTADPSTEGLFWRVRYDLLDNAAVIELRQVVDFQPGAGGTSNQNAVGAALNGGQIEADDGWAAVLSQLASLDEKALGAALVSISGEGLANASTSALGAGDAFREAIRQGGGGAGANSDVLGFASRLMLDSGGFSGRLAAENNINLDALEGGAGAGRPRGFWVGAYAGQSDLEGRAGQADVSTDLTGLAAGFNITAGAVTVGSAAGVSDLTGRADAVASEYEMSLNHLAIYGRYDDSVWFGDLTLTSYSGDMEAQRTVTVGAGAARTAGATTLNGHSLSAAIGRRFTLGADTQLAVGATGAASMADIEAYTETGAGGLSLEVARQRREWQTLAVDARLSRDYHLGGGQMRAYVGLGAQGAQGDLRALADMRFSGAAPGFGGFAVEGAETPPLAGIVDLGAAYHAAGGWTAEVGYRAVLADRLEDHRIGARLALRW